MGGSLGLNFSAEVAFTRHVDKSSATLFLKCGNGAHSKSTSIT